ncbi:hypothetical protein [Streptomyces indicus]|uniref:Uncharacterized protein n=1 Tax=Streptomyces indicus TaxID=417292 RepID=A0A1G9FU29_9ACTN|nr:hypothetical protein [Streptomyces indicus]SDK91857.1 hypothetical protein SAMN05421806_11462 [Streptomyces indicus]
MGKEIRRRLRVAAEEHQYAVVERSALVGADELQGFVVGTDREWTLLAVADTMALDGFAALRTRDISAVRRRSAARDLMGRWLRRHGPWPPPGPVGGAFPLGAARTVVEAAAQRYGLVSLFGEDMDPDVVTIGVPRSYGKRKLGLLEVDSRARWEREVTKVPYEEITRVDFGDRYNSVLAGLAGPCPS